MRPLRRGRIAALEARMQQVEDRLTRLENMALEMVGWQSGAVEMANAMHREIAEIGKALGIEPGTGISSSGNSGESPVSPESGEFSTRSKTDRPTLRVVTGSNGGPMVEGELVAWNADQAAGTIRRADDGELIPLDGAAVEWAGIGALAVGDKLAFLVQTDHRGARRAVELRLVARMPAGAA